ncbi:MAG: peptide chain release factor family protein [Armatimonadota bacterium]
MNNESPSTTTQSAIRNPQSAIKEFFELSEEELIKQCDWWAGRASGPGGQKRNKTHSAIRLTHKPTGISVIANEHRMQGENRALAMKRLRHALALAVRREVDIETFQIPHEVTEQVNKKGKLAVNPDNPRYLQIIGTMLDLVVTYKGHISEAAHRLGITTTNFVNVLHDDPKLWTEAQRLRQHYQLSPLKP